MYWNALAFDRSRFHTMIQRMAIVKDRKATTTIRTI